MIIWKTTPLLSTCNCVSKIMSVNFSNSLDVNRAVTAIYALPNKPAFSLAITGGGMQVLPMFLAVPGASACILDADVPYSRAAVEKFLSDNSYQTEESLRCTKEKALHMAKVAYLKTVTLLLEGEGQESPTTSVSINKTSTIFGVSCTAALASAVPKKGPHRVHIGLYHNTTQGGQGSTFSVVFDKGIRDRYSEDALCSRLILDVVSQHVGVPLLPDSLLLHQSTIHTNFANISPLIDTSTTEVVEVVRYPASDALANVTSQASRHALFFAPTDDLIQPRSEAAVTDGDIRYVCLENATLPAGSLVYPGSFNPLHDGHLSLVASHLDALKQHHMAKKDTPFRPPLVVFEIGAVNADKPPLPREEIMTRLAQFNPLTNPIFDKWGISNFAVSITSEPLFVSKSNIFQRCDFLIGADTMVRLINSKYYADKVGVDGDVNRVVDSENRRLANMVAALSRIVANNCRFIVGGRVKSVSTDGMVQSVFETSDDILSSAYDSISGAGAASSFPAEPRASSRVVDVLPQSIVNLFVNLTEEQFRLDLSSTELRSQGVTLN